MLGPVSDLDRQAADRPDAVAIATPSRRLTFRELRASVLSIARRLRHSGVGPASVVGLDLPGGLEWPVDLALFRIGARSVSLRGVSDPTAVPLDVLLTEPGRRATWAERTIEVDGSWLAERWIDGSGVTVDEPPAAYDDPTEIFRYLLTSGTTGVPRAAAYSVGAFDYRMADGDAHWTDGRPELTLIGLSTTGGFHAAAACLAHGIPYLAIDRIDPDSMAFVAAQDIRVLCGSPTQIAHAVHVAVGAGVRFRSLEEVRLAGAGPSERLLEFLAESLGVPVRGVYGSTEGGGVSQVRYSPGGDRFDVGAPLPDVELQVVDGAVRYRTPGLVSGYLVDGEVVPLPGGWFTPGDLGRMTPQGTLILAGRDSELFNIGGTKFDPARIDELAAAFPGVRDAAAFALERRAGIPEVGLAVVSGPDCDLRALDQELRARMPTGHPTAFWNIDVIPRTRLGKARRAQLTEDYERDVVRRAR